MPRTLEETISRLYEGDSRSLCWWSSGHGLSNPNVRYMDIPINQEVFEIPLLALDTFVNVIKNHTDDTTSFIAVSLNTVGREPRYKTVDRFMRDVLLEGYKGSRLIKLEVKQDSDTVLYYGTQGAVFDKEFNPIMICSYQIQRLERTVEVNAGEPDRIEYQYKLLRPILRVDPQVYLRKGNPLEKFIANKMVNGCLEDTFNLPPDHMLCRNFIRNDEKLPVKVIIDTCPFRPHQADTPSISTTNQKLLQVAIDHIDELIQ